MTEQSFVFLMRNLRRISQDMEVIFDLYAEGAVIRLVLLGPAALDWSAKERRFFQRCRRTGIELFTDQSALLDNLGFQVVDSSHAAAIISQADVVIPL